MGKRTRRTRTLTRTGRARIEGPTAFALAEIESELGAELPNLLSSVACLSFGAVGDSNGLERIRKNLGRVDNKLRVIGQRISDLERGDQLTDDQKAAAMGITVTLIEMKELHDNCHEMLEDRMITPRERMIAMASRFSGRDAAAVQDTLQLKVTLKGLKPPIWRRIMVPASWHLDSLHLLINRTMGWNDSHLHQFKIHGETFVDQDTRTSDLELEEASFTLADLSLAEGDKFEYLYDFGDHWLHEVKVEKIIRDEIIEAACIAGRRACPPDDCGGIWGYQRLLEVGSDPEHPDYDEWLEWFEPDYDPAKFTPWRSAR